MERIHRFYSMSAKHDAIQCLPNMFAYFDHLFDVSYQMVHIFLTLVLDLFIHSNKLHTQIRCSSLFIHVFGALKRFR